MPENNKNKTNPTGEINFAQWFFVIGILCYMAFLIGKTGGDFKLFDESLLKINETEITSKKDDKDLSKEKANQTPKQFITSNGKKIPDIDVLADNNVEELKAPFEGALFLIAEISNDLTDLNSYKNKVAAKNRVAISIIEKSINELEKYKAKNDNILKLELEKETSQDRGLISKVKNFLKDYVKIKKLSIVKLEQKNLSISSSLTAIKKHFNNKDYVKCLEIIVKSEVRKKTKIKADITLEEINIMNNEIDKKDFGKILEKLNQISNEIKN